MNKTEIEKTTNRINTKISQKVHVFLKSWRR